jgi:t-SNARE complex subunit (syntaxin)
MSTNPPSAALDHADSTIHDTRQRRTVLVAVCVALIAVIASVTASTSPSPSSP